MKGQAGRSARNARKSMKPEKAGPKSDTAGQVSNRIQTMNTLSVRIVDSPKDAPNYKGGDFKGATFREAVIVCQGTQAGKATVDLVFEVKDADGNVTDIAIAMITGEIVKALAGAVQGAEDRPKG